MINLDRESEIKVFTSQFVSQFVEKLTDGQVVIQPWDYHDCLLVIKELKISEDQQETRGVLISLLDGEIATLSLAPVVGLNAYVVNGDGWSLRNYLQRWKQNLI